jgi:predicted dehydrogenase
LKKADDWRNDESMAGGGAFFEEGIHWLHLANSLGPVITTIRGCRPSLSTSGPDRRVKSMMVAFEYDNGAVGSLYYSREVPSLFKGLRLSKLFGRKGVITFESNAVAILARGGGIPRVILGAIRQGRQPEMSVERAMADHNLINRVYASLAPRTGGSAR